MTNCELNPFIWFCERELEFKPKHFVTANTPLTSESKKWIYEKLTGRFSIVSVFYTSPENSNLLDGLQVVPSFEDPSEATFYELTWS